MSWGHRPRPKDWLVNNGLLDEAADAMMKAVRVIRDYDVPYVGSCSRDGRKIYIDHRLPPHLEHRGKRYDIDRYITMHEVVEMLFEHVLHFQYRDAHQIALRAERALVESDGLPWAVYGKFCAKWIKAIGERRHYPNPPPDIDLQPEIDEDDKATLRRMGATRAAKTGKNTMR
ncbi:MAG: hypothetical protein JSS21_11270 [Proteobacteria bacterium]|nr:hypothetical protein [Pseudomonadota bacterium]